MLSVMADSKKPQLKKHVALIHSTNSLSLLERKIANALLLNAYDNLLTQNEHQIRLPQLCQLIGYNSKDTKTIKIALMSLMSIVLEWNLLDDQKQKSEVWVASTMLSDAQIEGSLCTYSYSNRLRELCYYPELYGRLNVAVMAKFKSTYGLALYENCTRYQNISQTPWFTLGTYRKLMGVEKQKYEIFRDLKRRVIKPAVAEVNRHAAITVVPEFKKQGRSVVAIRFLISRHSEKVISQPAPHAETFSLEHKLAHCFGLSEPAIKHLMNTYRKADIVDKVNLIEASPSYQNHKINNLARYLETALAENYQSAKTTTVKSLQHRTLEAKEKRLLEEKRTAYRAYQNKTLPETVQQLTASQQKTIAQQFKQYIKTTLYANVFLKEGMNHPLIQDKFGEFVRQQHRYLLDSLLSFEAFCCQLETQ